MCNIEEIANPPKQTPTSGVALIYPDGYEPHNVI